MVVWEKENLSRQYVPLKKRRRDGWIQWMFKLQSDLFFPSVLPGEQVSPFWAFTIVFSEEKELC